MAVQPIAHRRYRRDKQPAAGPRAATECPTRRAGSSAEGAGRQGDDTVCPTSAVVEPPLAHTDDQVAVLDDHPYGGAVVEHLDVRKWIAVDHQEVCPFPDLDGAAVGQPERPR